jgi:hypothetical protein
VGGRDATVRVEMKYRVKKRGRRVQGSGTGKTKENERRDQEHGAVRHMGMGGKDRHDGGARVKSGEGITVTSDEISKKVYVTMVRRE